MGLFDFFKKKDTSATATTNDVTNVPTNAPQDVVTPSSDATVVNPELPPESTGSDPVSTVGATATAAVASVAETNSTPPVATPLPVTPPVPSVEDTSPNTNANEVVAGTENANEPVQPPVEQTVQPEDQQENKNTPPPIV